LAALVQSSLRCGPGALANANRLARGLRPRRTLENRGIGVPTQATGRARIRQESCTAKLAKFFPEASPVRIPVRLTRVVGEKASTENTVIEFGTAREVLFSSTLPLEFADLLRLQNSDGTLDAEASVVALQYTSGRTAVAARFTQEVSNWIVKP
jgi:hypothetical protein